MPTMSSASDAVLAALVKNLSVVRPFAKQKVKSRLETLVKKYKSKDILTFATSNGGHYPPEASSEYVKAIWHFVWAKPLDGYPVNSAINPDIMQATAEALADAFSSAEAQQALAKPLPAEVLGRISSKAANSANEKWLEKLLQTRIRKAAHDVGGEFLRHKAGELAADQLVVFFSTAAGAAVLTAFLNYAQTAAGHQILVHAIQYAIASGALHQVNIALLHKFGVLAVVQAFLLHTLGAQAPVLAGTVIPVINHVVIAAMLAYLAWAVWTLPKKALTAIPAQVSEQIEKNWDDIAKAFVMGAVFEEAKRQYAFAEIAHTRMVRRTIWGISGLALLAAALAFVLI